MQIIKHKRTWPYVSGSDGELVEQFAQTSLREWDYAKPYWHSSDSEGDELAKIEP
ncbi:MAG: hypothetical protein ACLPX9_18875 [Rhodomicrobium sp.]